MGESREMCIRDRETYSDEMLELMRDECGNLRDLAIIDMLASTGMRVGELVRLNRADIDFEGRECVVLGKGSKERPVYFDARTKIHLQNYLLSRSDAVSYTQLDVYKRQIRDWSKTPSSRKWLPS